MESPVDVRPCPQRICPPNPFWPTAKQPGDWRTGYIEHAEELINYHTAFGGRELGAARAKQLTMVARSQYSARR